MLGSRQDVTSLRALGGRGYLTSLGVSTDRENYMKGDDDRSFSTKSKPYVSKGAYGSGTAATARAKVVCA